MKKSKIIAAIVLLAMFSSMFVVAKTHNITITAKSSAPVVNEEPSVEPDAYTGTPLGDKGIWLYNNTGGGAITIDGDLSDWAGIPTDMFGGVYVYLAYDASNVYVAITWEDSSNDDDISHWNKTGMENATHAIWEQLPGADDMLVVGFDNGTYQDTWIWTASIRTDGAHAYEPGDAGDEPFVENIDATGTMPIYDNSSNPIADYSTIPNGTVYKGWLAQAPTGSQTDVALSSSWNASGNNMYVVEFSRALDTGNDDDISFDFTDLTDQSFFVGVANKHDATNWAVSTSAFSLAEGNDAATLTFDVIPNADGVDGSLLVRGNVYDDYAGWTFIIYMEGWTYTYGAGAYDFVDVNTATGNWSYLFIYNQWDMPLGDDNIWIEFYPKYDAPIVLNRTVTIIDEEAPTFIGIVDLAERYPDGVSINETSYVTVTAGIQDNYWEKYDLEAHLYSYKDDGVALMTPLVQFDPYGTTFSANITISYTPGAPNNYTYFIDAFDPELNKAVSDKFYFIVVTDVEATPGFGFIVAILGLLGASFIAYKKFKK